VKFQFDSSVPSEVEEAITPILDDIRPLFPLWMQMVRVGWDANNSGDEANIRVNKDYRFARLTICPPLLGLTGEMRKETLIHETVHCFNETIVQAVKQELQAILDDPKEVKRVMKRIRKTAEQVTQDFAYSLARTI
jgi:hypothetical protein